MTATTATEQIVEEYTLDNRWRVYYQPENVEEDRTYTIGFTVGVRNGEEWEEVIRGQVKWDGCSDWGYAERVVWHICGIKDCDLMGIVYKRCGELLGGFD